MGVTEELMSRAQRALSAATGTNCVLDAPEELSGSGRSMVVRCAVSGGRRGHVVVKAYRDRPAFPNEAAGLGVAAAGRVPELLAVDDAWPLIVMSDLGTGPTLGRRLLGADAEATTNTLRSWADGLGALAVAAHGREGEFFSARRSLAHGAAEDPTEPAAVRLPRLADVLRQAGVPAAPGLAAELTELARLKDDGPCPVFSPGDTCPDNAVVGSGGQVRFLDLESCGYTSAFLVGAYLRMPFATCWCVFRLPERVAGLAEQDYRRHLVRIHPELADDSRWRRGTAAATALWTAGITVGLLPAADQGDRPMHPTVRPVPTARQLLRYRWERLLDVLEPGDELPAIRHTGELLLGELADRWGPGEAVPHYPAFTRSVLSGV